MRSFASLAVVVGAVLALASSSALGAAEVPGTSATFNWDPSSGPVDSYRVEVSRNGGSYRQEKTVSGPWVTVTGQYGEKVRVRVVACSANGSCGKCSKASTKVKFVDPDDPDGSAAKAAAKEAKAAAKAEAKAAKAAAKAEAKAAKLAAKAAKNQPEWVDLPPPPPAVPLVQGAIPYDFNGDGSTDLLWRNRQTQAVAIWLMNGTSPSSVIDLGMLEKKWAFLGSGDFDGDGYADLLLQWSRSVYEIWFMENGRVRNAVQLEGPPSGYKFEELGDFDGDGYVDLLWRKGKSSLFWFMRGWTVDEAVAGPIIKKLSPAVCAPDLDADGRSDLVWRGGKETVSWLMAGASPWRSGPAGPGMKKSQAIGCGDADGDGFDDVLWFHKRLGGILWVMDGNLAVELSLELPALESGWVMEASGDFNGMGNANEVLVRDTKTGAIEIWQLQWNGAGTSFDVAATPGAGMGSKDWEVVAP
jgi:hypothetical protein